MDLSLKDTMGALAVAMAVVAYGIYVWQTLRGGARPHPLSWLIFGILSGTGYLVQLDQDAGPGSWVMFITAVVCLLLCPMSFWRGERVFPWYEWAFLVIATVIFIFYLWSRQPTVSAVLASVVNAVGFQRGWFRPDADQSLVAPAHRQRHHIHSQWPEIRAVAVGDGQHFGRDLRDAGEFDFHQPRGGRDHLRAAQNVLR
jgi:hypothetical protein